MVNEIKRSSALSRQSIHNRENTSASQPEERTKRQARAERILEAAAALIERWGYNKTTMDDIARQAGVAKGTLYLHWKTKEDLFRALYYHESVKLAVDVQQRIARDPEGMSLPGMMKHSMLATAKNPLIKAIMTRDAGILGEFARREYSDALIQQSTEEYYKTLFETLRSQGLLRSDMSIVDLVFVLSAITWGFLVIGPYLLEEFQVSDERAAELLADTIQRAFEPREPVAPERAKVAAEMLTSYLDEAIGIVREQDKRGMEP